MIKLELSNRQAELLENMKLGLNQKESALKMGVSISRATNLLNEIFWKSGLENKKELIKNLNSIEYLVKNDEK